MNADWSGVYAVTDKLRIEDFFRYDNWRIPGMWATYETNIFGAAGSGADRIGAADFAIQSGFADDGCHVRGALSRGALQPGGLSRCTPPVPARTSPTSSAISFWDRI